MTATTQAFQLLLSNFVDKRCGAQGSKLGTPTYGNEGIVFTTCAELEIQGSVREVYDAILDFSQYSYWNSFVVDVVDQSGRPPREGVIEEIEYKMTFTTKGLLPVGLNSTSGEIVTFAERDVSGDGGSVGMSGWRYDGFGQRAEHVNVLTDLGDGRTR